MRVIPPVTITDAKLTSSGAAEPHAPAAYSGGTTYAVGDIVKVVADFTIYESLLGSNTGHTPSSSPTWWRILGPTEDAYNSGTTYAVGATVYVASTHRCYESLQAGNVGNTPPTPPETTTAWWTDVGPTNKWAMFDLARNTQTVKSSPLTVVITPGERVNSVGFTGLKGNSLVLSATSVAGGGTVYGPTTFDLNTREIVDGYGYFFEPFSTRLSIVVFDMPPYTDIIITATLSATSGNVKCGSMVIGTYVDLGQTLRPAENDAINFSKIDRDVFGNATLVPRRTIPKTNQTCLIDESRINLALAARVALNAVPALWCGLDDSSSDWFEMLSILGVYKTFRIGTTQADKAELTLELEEI